MVIPLGRREVYKLRALATNQPAKSCALNGRNRIHNALLLVGAHLPRFEGRAWLLFPF